MSIGISATGRLNSLESLPRGQDGELDLEKLFVAAADAASEMYAPLFVGARIASDHALFTLFPNSDEAMLSVDGSGGVSFEISTTPVGAGFHASIHMLLTKIGEAIGVTWDEISDDSGAEDPEDLGSLQEAFANWGMAIASSMRDQRLGALDGVAVCMPLGTIFHYPSAVVTPFGPWDGDLLSAVASSREAAAAWMPWMELSPTAQTLLDAARSLMWCNVCWRETSNDDVPEEEEHAYYAMKKALDLLDAAYELDPELDYPWHEWLELIGIEGEGRENATVVEAQANATEEPDEEDLIGYRRSDVTVWLPFGATIRIPGEMTSDFNEDGWVAGGETGSIHITPYSARETDTEARASARVMLSEAWTSIMSDFEGETIGEPFEWEGEGFIGRAEHRTDVDEEGDTIYMTQGLVARAGEFLFTTMIYFEDEQRPWAQATFQSIVVNERNAYSDDDDEMDEADADDEDES